MVVVVVDEARGVVGCGWEEGEEEESGRRVVEVIVGVRAVVVAALLGVDGGVDGGDRAAVAAPE